MTELEHLRARVAQLTEMLREAVDREYNDFEPDNQSDRYKRWAAALAAQAPADQSPSPSRPAEGDYVRYCPECGRIGEVPSTALNCCPDGGRARMVPQAIAEQAREGFRAMYLQPKGDYVRVPRESFERKVARRAAKQLIAAAKESR